MDTTIESLPSIEQMACESAGWFSYCIPHPEILPDPPQLLASSAQPRVGNQRFALDGSQVSSIGELRDADGMLTLPEAHRLLTDAASGAGDRAAGISPLDVACMLAETGFEWAEVAEEAAREVVEENERTDSLCPPQWRATTTDSNGQRCELSACIVPDGVEIRGRLADWDAGLAESSRAAITRFFVTVHARVRFVRFTLQGHEACAVSFATADRLEVELADSVAAVVAAVRMVWHEVRALANEEVAQAYLQAATGNCF